MTIGFKRITGGVTSDLDSLILRKSKGAATTTFGGYIEGPYRSTSTPALNVSDTYLLDASGMNRNGTTSPNWLYIDSKGTLIVRGDNTLGQLGDTTSTFSELLNPPYGRVPGVWKNVTHSGDHTLAIRSDGTLWSWGFNSSGELGQNNTIHRSSPVQIAGSWKAISAARGTSLAIKTDGTLWSWGRGNNGQNGDINAVHRSSPVQIGALSNWVIAASGVTYKFAIQDSGALFGWGFNNEGNIGDITNIHRSSPVQVSVGSSWAAIAIDRLNGTSIGIRSNNTLWRWGAYTFTTRSSPVQIGALTDWLSVGSVYDSTLQAPEIVLAKTDGTLWVIGPTYFTTAQSPVQVTGVASNVFIRIAAGGVPTVG
jgi:hypothetical protein